MPPNNLLKIERDKRGWSQAEVAKMINAGEASYHRWESQGVMPTRKRKEKRISYLVCPTCTHLRRAGTWDLVEIQHCN